jgi:starch-binding outer membrane protein, SusD/RagB family
MKRSFIIMTILVFFMSFSSCEKFLDVPLPVDQLATESVFSSKSTIEATVIGLYNGFANLGSASDYVYTNYLSDELYYPTVAGSRNNLAIASITPDESMVNSWAHHYTVIHRANIVIENLPGVSTEILTTAERDRYMGEAKYLRAASYLFMVNFWGEVPLIVTSGLNDNLNLPRAPISQVYEQITQDLEDAVALLPVAVSADPNRIHNKFQAEALLARVYLYRGLWSEAETAANNVITQSGYYELLPNLLDVFKRNSKETIFSYREILLVSIILDKSYFGLSLIADVNHAIHPTIEARFDAGDARFINWTRLVSGRRQAFKYIHSLTANASSNPQDFVVQRFAELYLIRAEARAQQNKLTGPDGAIADINTIRTRALLTDTPAVTQSEVLEAIEDERIRELFTEGHRWFDLKRTNQADLVLGALDYKAANYQPYMRFMPIASTQIDANPALTQTDGYN